MNEKGANIDLLFRNGLKDYEVLPPAGVWEGIHPVVKIKSQPVILLRVAAVITVLVTVSLLTFKWSRDISNLPSGDVMAFNIPESSPLISVPVDNHQYLPVRKSILVKNTPDILIEKDISAPQEIESISSPEQVTYVKETKSLSITDGESNRSSFLNPSNSTGGSQAKIKYSDLQYFTDNTTTKPKNRWSIAAMASPTYLSSFNSGSDELSKELTASEQSLISYSGGVAFSYKISRRFSIQSGLYYSSLGQKVDGINSFSGFQPYGTITKGDHNFEVLTANGTVYTNNPDVFLSANGAGRIVTAYTNDVFDPKKASLQPVSTSLDQNFKYLELPVILKYKLIDKTIGINLIGGLSYNLLVSNSVSTTVDGNRYSIGNTHGLNPLTLSSSLGMGMEYNLSTKLSLNLEPTFRYYLNPFSVSTGSYIHPYSFGIFSGVSYKF
jgi:hypothetical protein